MNLLVWGILMPWSLSAQDNDYLFKNYTEKDGLCDNIVFTMVKDKSNILWIGTQTGLSRFDGKHFYNFKQIQENGRYVSNTVASLCTDDKGQLWGGTHYGLFKFNPSTGKFNVYFPFENKRSNFFENVMCDSKGNIYASAKGGILKYNESKNLFEMWKMFSTDSSDPISKLAVGKNNILLDEKNHCFWMGTTIGLGKFDYHTNKFTEYQNVTDNELYQQRVISAISMTHNGECWFFDNTHQKMVSFDPVSEKTIKNIDIGSIKFLGNASTSLVDSDHRIWLSGWGFQTKIIDMKNNTVIDLKNAGMLNGIGSQFFWSAFEDDNHSIWLGTLNGISTYNSNPLVYKALKLPEIIQEIDKENIFSIEEDINDHSYWLLTLTTRLIQYFPDEKKYIKYDISQFKRGPKDQKPSVVLQMLFIDGYVYLLTDKGFFRKKKDAKIFEQYTVPLSQYKNFSIAKVAYKNPYWYFSDYEKILIYNSDTKQEKLISHKVLSDNKVYKLFPLSNGGCTAITISNYIVYTNENGKEAVDSSFCKQLCNSVGYISGAEMDNADRIWMASKGVGLFMLDRKKHQCKRWTDADGMAEKDIHDIAIDRNQQIWGIYWNKVLVFDPVKNIFNNFKIPFSEHNLNYHNYLDPKTNGNVLALLGNDIFELDINHLNKSPQKTKPSFSVVSFSGKQFFDTDDRVLTLSPKENHLRIKYGLLVDPVSFPHTFEYILEGAENQWNHSTTASEITYSNLPSGNYTFKIKAVNKSTNWESELKSIQFEIATPLYFKSWFIALVIAILLTGIALFYYYRMRERDNMLQLRSKAHQLEKEKAQMMFDSLKQQLNPHFLFNSLTSLSELIDADQALAGRFLNQMSDMYRYILKNGDAELVGLNEELTFIKTYYNLQKTRFGEGLQLNIDINTDTSNFQIAPVTLQNMMENAIKHNIIDEDDPLVIDISIEGEYLVVKNNSQPKKNVETSNKRGIAQFKSLYKYLSPNPVMINHTDSHFIIKIPLIKKLEK